MLRVLVIIPVMMLWLPCSVISQEEITVAQYIEIYKAIAIREMDQNGIPASITLAQGILESGCGNSTLAREANNHFGIKCHEGWTGKTYHQDDDEKDECFRKYKDAEESYEDHSAFLTTRNRYDFLFDLDITDYKGWAYGLKKAGYATNPRYPEMLIRIIEENGLAALDQVRNGQLAEEAHSGKNPHDKPVSRSGNLESDDAPTAYEIAGRGGNDRILFRNNGVKFILARDGDTPYALAVEFGIYSWQIFKYNELDKKDMLIPGQKIYLEPKRSRSTDYQKHKVVEGETLQSVSQDFGIRMKALKRRNGITGGDALKAGMVLNLR